MTDETDNPTIRRLQEMRAETRDMLVNLNERIDGLELKIDGNTVLLNLVAGVAHDHEQRRRLIASKSS